MMVFVVSDKRNIVVNNLKDATTMYKQQLADYKEEQQRCIEAEVRDYIEQTMQGDVNLADIKEEINNIDDAEFRAIYYKSLNHVLYKKLFKCMVKDKY